MTTVDASKPSSEQDIGIIAPVSGPHDDVVFDVRASEVVALAP